MSNLDRWVALGEGRRERARMSEDNPPISGHVIDIEFGRTAERAIIVAWLRSHEGNHARVFANAIEAGEHLAEIDP